MKFGLRETARFFWLAGIRRQDEQLKPYFTFFHYRRIWAMGIIILGTTALVPLIVVTVIHHQLIETSVDSEFMLRTGRSASNARRAVTFFLEERLDALRFTVNENGYEGLTKSGRLAEILTNLRLGFGGLTDLSIITDTGNQVAYAGPFRLKGKNYSDQPWYIESRKHDTYVSTIFKGYRDIPHIIIAVKSLQEDGRAFILRATLDTEKLMQALVSYRTGEHADIFLIDQGGILQTPSIFYGQVFQRLPHDVPSFSSRTQVIEVMDRQFGPALMGYAYIQTKTTGTPFVLIVVKQKEGMMGVWRKLRTDINAIVGVGFLIILVVITLTCTYIVNKLYAADKAKAETMVLMEQNNQLVSIGQLAAGVAHEINNPLALINQTAGYVKDLFVIKEQYSDDDELLELIDIILDAVDRCGTITSQLLRFSRKFDVRIEKIDLRDIISDVLIFHHKEAEYRNIDITVDVADDVSFIETDRGKLQQIVMNLVNNAFHAMENGCHLSIRAFTENADRVGIAVSDNGCGMSEECMAKIFEPFFTTKEKGKGTGLGLPITYGLVKKINGRISVDSKENQGTTFTVSLPVRLGGTKG